MGRAGARGSSPARRAAVRLIPLLAVTVLGVALPAGGGDAMPLRESAHDSMLRLAVARPPAAVAYARVRAHGQPIATLLRATALRATPGGRRVAHLAIHTEFGSPRVFAAVQERGGWLRVMASQLPNGSTGWIPASATSLMADPWQVRASLSQRRVEVLRHGHVVRSFTVAIGRGQTPTPVGAYAVTDRLIILNRGVGYGCCALALTGHQPNLPQGWGGGDRLAIHASDVPESIGGNTSVGCLRAANRNARWLITHVYLGTIVTIRP